MPQRPSPHLPPDPSDPTPPTEPPTGDDGHAPPPPTTGADRRPGPDDARRPDASEATTSPPPHDVVPRRPPVTEAPASGASPTTADNDTLAAHGAPDAGSAAGAPLVGDPGASEVPDGEGPDPTQAGDGDGDGDGDGGEGEAAEGEGGEGTSGGKKKGKGKQRSGWGRVVEWGIVVGGALLVAVVVRAFLFQAFWIPSASMEPTLHEGDRVLVNKLSYDLHDVHRGDVVVFKRPIEPGELIGDHPENQISDLIKRVVGLPGDTIESRDGDVYVNGERLDEPYLPADTPTEGLDRQEVPEGTVFVMGDNRTNSHDSRAFGPIDQSSIVGRAFVRFYPLDDIGGL